MADVEIGEDALRMSIRLTLEAPVAGVDLEGLEDTNAAENSDAYDRLRALDPEDLRAELEAAWPRIANLITLRAGDELLQPTLDSISIPEVGNEDLPRFSTILITADLPPGDAPIVIGWDASLGGLIVREQGVENPYTGFLQNGDLSEEIARSGGSGNFWQTVRDFTVSGFEHIIPKGLDHILFVLGLFFFALKWGPMLWQVSAFTVAHTVTLALATLGVVTIPPDWMWLVEALIALSISYVAIENIFRPDIGWLRPAVVFAFGLLHGLGFASVLSDVGLPQGQLVTALIAFNVGVELGQLAVIFAAFLVILAARGAAGIGRLDDEELVIRDMPALYRAVALTGSIIIAIIGLYWFFERIGVL